MKALQNEMKLRRAFLENETIDTIYFGGGTPSRLSVIEVEEILNGLSHYFKISEHPEITLEANPDDISTNWLDGVIKLGVNRLSMGIQSFQQEELKLMGRQHTPEQSIDAVHLIRESGISNFNLDLIYGVPGSSSKSWEENLDRIIALEPNHISAYGLTIEAGTRLDYQVKKGRVVLPDEELVINQFKQLVNRLQNAGYEHYEISNFAKPGKHSRHNTSYWEGKTYLGLGPSSHSYKDDQRWVNIPNTPRYVKTLELDKLPIESEELSANDRYNEYVMTRLRTHWGINLKDVENQYGTRYATHLNEGIQPGLKQGMLLIEDNVIKLSEDGKLVADRLASDLFWVD